MNARRRKNGLISLRYRTVFSLMVRYRIMIKTRRENPTEI
jgi:hypothetical protein